MGVQGVQVLHGPENRLPSSGLFGREVPVHHAVPQRGLKPLLFLNCMML
jgi:hypothetical protein